MTPLDLILVGAAFGLSLLATWIRRRRRDADTVVQDALDELSQTIPEARPRAYRRLLSIIEDNLVSDRSLLSKVAARLVYLARMRIDIAASFIAQHRRTLGLWLLGFDVVAQTAISAIQRPESPWIYFPLAGAALAALYAVFGIIATWIVALAFRRRPLRGWLMLDVTALVSGSVALLAAMSMMLGRGVVDPEAASSLEHLMDIVATPLIVWGGLASGLLLGVAHQQDEEVRLEQLQRRLERRIATWQEGITKLMDLARQLGGILSIVMIIGVAVASPMRSQSSNVVASRVPLGTRDSACFVGLDGSRSLATRHVKPAIDSAMSVAEAQWSNTGCVALLATVVTSDTAWASRMWFRLPTRPSAAMCSSGTGRAGAMAGAFRAINPAAAAGDERKARKLCAATLDSLGLKYEQRLSAIRRSVIGFLNSARPMGTTDSSAIVQMVAMMGAPGFAAGVLVTDGIENKAEPTENKDKSSIPPMKLASSGAVMIICPADSAFGGVTRSMQFAAVFRANVPRLVVVPYVNVASVRGRFIPGSSRATQGVPGASQQLPN